MARAKTPEERKDLTIKVRLTADEKKLICEQADFAGISHSEFIRRCAENTRIFASTDLAMLRELRRIGGLLKYIHNTSNGAYSIKTAEMLNDLHAVIKAISHDNKTN